MNTRLRKLVLLSLLIAMIVLGANFKIMGSIALDSFPAFIGTALLGPVFGMCLVFIGHMVSAYFAGFPLSFPIHLLISMMMMATMFGYGWVRKRDVKPSISKIVLSNIVAYIGNVPLSLVILIPFYGAAGITPLLLPLTLATVANLVITEFVFVSLPVSYKTKIAKL